MKHEDEYYDDLLTELMTQTFHHDDEEAKPIVDEFVKNHPEILDKFELKFLYKV